MNDERSLFSLHLFTISYLYYWCCFISRNPFELCAHSLRRLLYYSVWYNNNGAKNEVYLSKLIMIFVPSKNWMKRSESIRSNLIQFGPCWLIDWFTLVNRQQQIYCPTQYSWQIKYFITKYLKDKSKIKRAVYIYIYIYR